jgi:hypothetical protein
MAIGLLVTGCAGSGPKPTAHHTSRPETTGPVSLESPRAQQISLARASNRLFSIFPGRPRTKKCGIPEGGAHFKPLPGRCETSIRFAATHEPALIVSFTETWRTSMPSRAVHHTWQVIEGEPLVTTGARLRILATRERGATAPQYYK